MNIKEFPNLKRIKIAISNLKDKSYESFDAGKHNPDSFSGKVIQDIVNEIGFNFNYLKPFIASQINLSLFRARPLDDFIDINLIREHTYPPLNFTKLGRCNFPLKPVFYCSPNPQVSLFEVSRQYPDKSKKYALSKWSIIILIRMY